MSIFTPFEKDLLDLLLSGEDPVLTCLSLQLKSAVVRCREYTGVGQYTTFEFTSPVKPLEGQPSFCFGDVLAKVDGVPSGVGCVLWIDQGLIDTLEIYTYQEELPTDIQAFAVRYLTDSGLRDLETLRSTAGWPGSHCDPTD